MKLLQLRKGASLGLVVALGIISGMCGLVDAYAAKDEAVFVEDEAYPEGSCHINRSTRGFLWTILVNDKMQKVCCAVGQMPTGKVKGTEQRCAQPSRPRGDCGQRDADPTFCTGKKPFKICCPSGQIARCDPDPRNRQCLEPPLGLTNHDSTPVQ